MRFERAPADASAITRVTDGHDITDKNERHPGNVTDRLVPTAPNWSLPHPDWVAIVPQTLGWGVRAVGFWLAVAMPFLYLPLLVDGFSGRAELLAFVALVALNAATLVVGHEHRLSDGHKH